MTDRPTPDALAAVRIFTGLSRPTLERLAAAASARSLADGESLFEQGGEPRDLYLVTRGRLALRVADGDRSTTVQTVEAEDLLGWSALRAGARWLTTARASGAVDVTAIPLATILDVIEAGGPDARRLAQALFAVGAAHLDAIRQQLQQPPADPLITGG
jgi:CRP-like cAMP-binding protein